MKLNEYFESVCKEILLISNLERQDIGTHATESCAIFNPEAGFNEGNHFLYLAPYRDHVGYGISYWVVNSLKNSAGGSAIVVEEIDSYKKTAERLLECCF